MHPKNGWPENMRNGRFPGILKSSFKPEIHRYVAADLPRIIQSQQAGSRLALLTVSQLGFRVWPADALGRPRK